jgi:hypothetical protein
LSNETAWPFFNGGNALKENFDRWTPATPNGKQPRVTLNTGSPNYQTSSFWIKDASYLRLRSVELAYSIPKNISNKMRLQGLRVYANANNVFTISDIKTSIRKTAIQGAGRTRNCVFLISAPRFSFNHNSNDIMIKNKDTSFYSFLLQGLPVARKIYWTNCQKINCPIILFGRIQMQRNNLLTGYTGKLFPDLKGRNLSGEQVFICLMPPRMMVMLLLNGQKARHCTWAHSTRQTLRLRRNGLIFMHRCEEPIWPCKFGPGTGQ